MKRRGQITAVTFCRGITFAALLGLVACDLPLPVQPVLTPQARPASLPAPGSGVRPTSTESAALRSYLVQVQTAQLNQGLLRQDGGGPDTPVTADMLARNFTDIVFYNEYNENLSGRGGKSPLRRWKAPVRMEVIFGASVPPSLQKADESAVRQYASRLSRLTGHPITTSGKPNFLVIIAGEDDRGELLDQIPTLLPGISPRSLNALRDLRRDTYCLVSAYPSASDASTYTAAFAIIRAENPDLLRLACIHEELAQGLGLANDSPDARPSIFNDDDEFALLTDHDELLLKMLYDRRLKPGMSAEGAAPILRTIAKELK
ncbi:MAG: DUF2927 domain-containing protein [Sulfitobacter sp.]